MSYKAERVINGTFGELWLDNEYIAEVTSFQATVEQEKTEVKQCNNLVSGHKITGKSCKGSMKLNHIRSLMVQKLSASFKNNTSAKFTMRGRLSDPDAYGSEAVTLYGVEFDKLTLMDFENGKLGEESYDFTFDDWDSDESINVTMKK